MTMPSGTGNSNKTPPTGRRQTRGSPKRAVPSEAVSQDTSSQITQQGSINRRRSPRKRNQPENLTNSGQLQAAFLVSQLTFVTHLVATSDVPQNHTGSASKSIPIRGTSSRSRTFDEHLPATPKRNHRALRPEQGASNLTTPIDFNSTPPVQAYAGPTFHASPAPSALPIPRLFSTSVPVGGKTTNMKATVQDPSLGPPSNESDDFLTMRNAIQVDEGTVREASPLDIFFNADRAEKMRRAAANPASSPLTRSPAHLAVFPQSVDHIPGFDREQAKAKSKALKEYLRASQTKEDMPYFSPATPLPLQFDIGRRLAQLEGYLNPQDPRCQPLGQHLNIRKVIDLYKTGALAGGEQVCVCQGKIISFEDIPQTREWKWLEVCRPLLGKSMNNTSVIGTAVSPVGIERDLWSCCWCGCRMTMCKNPQITLCPSGRAPVVGGNRRGSELFGRSGQAFQGGRVASCGGGACKFGRGRGTAWGPIATT